MTEEKAASCQSDGCQYGNIYANAVENERLMKLLSRIHLRAHYWADDNLMDLRRDLRQIAAWASEGLYGENTTVEKMFNRKEAEG